jgi:DNA phosphorothioation-associated putative methyltransferase
MSEIICRPENTAIGRSQPSAPLRYLLATRCIPGSFRVLDFGCGRGRDAQYLNKRCNIDATGYDPNFPEFADWPEGEFDVVLMTYVLNVIDTMTERMTVLSEAWSKVKSGGSLFITTRTVRDIQRAASAKTPWISHNDGYWSDPRRGMFQIGMCMETLEYMWAYQKETQSFKCIKQNPFIVEIKKK